MSMADVLMRPARLREYLAAKVVMIDEKGALSFVARLQWCEPGEDRLGYTQLVRLVECVRELHWRRLMVPDHYDSVVGRARFEFVRPVQVGLTYELVHRVDAISRHTYELVVDCLSAHERAKHFTARLIVVTIHRSKSKALPVACLGLSSLPSDQE
jgi:acyl-CoA thioesterase FadM